MIPIIDNFCIRQWREDDGKHIVKYANNPKIAANLRDGFPYPYALSDAERFVAMAMAKDPQTFLAIVNDDAVIGSIGLAVGGDVHRYTAEMGYWLAEPFWGQGITTRAVVAFSDWAFEQLDLIRIAATPYGSNAASARVLEKAGFTYEGRLKGAVFKNGRVQDMLVYARYSDENALRLQESVC